MPFLADKYADRYFDNFLKGEKSRIKAQIVFIKGDIADFRDGGNFKKILRSVSLSALQHEEEPDFFEGDFPDEDPFGDAFTPPPGRKKKKK